MSTYPRYYAADMGRTFTPSVDGIYDGPFLSFEAAANHCDFKDQDSYSTVLCKTSDGHWFEWRHYENKWYQFHPTGNQKPYHHTGMRYYIFNEYNQPVCWDEKVLEFDDFKSACKFLESCLSNGKLTNGNSVIKECCFNCKDGYLNATNTVMPPDANIHAAVPD